MEHTNAPESLLRRTYYPNGQLWIEEWRKNDRLHAPAPSVPARREWYENGQLKSEEWLSEAGERYSPNSETPAHRIYYPNGQLLGQRWYNSGALVPKPRPSQTRVAQRLVGSEQRLAQRQ